MRDLGGGSYLCPSCDTAVGLESLVANSSKQGGYGAYCKPCHNKHVTAYHLTENGRLAMGRNRQRNYASGKAGIYFSKAFN